MVTYPVEHVFEGRRIPIASPMRCRIRGMAVKKGRFSYPTKGTCSSEISFSVVDGKLHGVKFTGGCRGNTRGLSRMLEGVDSAQARRKLKGIRCGDKGTSCPDQFARAIEAWGKARRKIPR